MAGQAGFSRAIAIVDIGGQDSRGIVLEEGGDRRSFRMNRKCVAGTEASPEDSANPSDTPRSAVSGTAGEATANVERVAFCSVLAKTKLLALIAHGTPCRRSSRPTSVRSLPASGKWGRWPALGGQPITSVGICNPVSAAITRSGGM
jgi:hypothetical protein